MKYVLLCALFALSIGCSAVCPTAQHGVDLLENTERSYATRVSAGVGSLVGQTVGIPFMLLLLPSYRFEVYGWGGREPTENEGAAAPGDFAVPLVLIPLEYGAGIGAAVMGYPSAAIEEAIVGPPGLDDAWVDETPERLPGNAASEEVAAAH